MENHIQPEELVDKVIVTNHSVSVNSLHPEVIALSTGEKLRLRKVEYVLTL